MAADQVKGYLFAGFSVLLVTFAQLAMKWGMDHLPPLSMEWLQFAMYWQAQCWVMAGIAAYVASLGCWMTALHSLPLNRAYPLLSISYGLVYVLAGALPIFAEHYSLLKSAGVLLIVAGVVLINGRRAR